MVGRVRTVGAVRECRVDLYGMFRILSFLRVFGHEACLARTCFFLYCDKHSRQLSVTSTNNTNIAAYPLHNSRIRMITSTTADIFFSHTRIIFHSL